MFRGILFKFAVDREPWIFEKDDSLAAKVAGADLRGLEHALNANVEGE